MRMVRPLKLGNVGPLPNPQRAEPTGRTAIRTTARWPLDFVGWLWCHMAMSLGHPNVAKHTVDGNQKSGMKKPVVVGSLSHYLQGFLHSRWFRIFFINGRKALKTCQSSKVSDGEIKVTILKRTWYFCVIPLQGAFFQNLMLDWQLSSLKMCWFT